MTISQPQMRMLHAAARDVGLGHDDLKASALKMFGAVSLKDLEPHQAGQMIDDLLEKSGKPKPMPEPIKPLYTRFPRRSEMGKPKPTTPAPEAKPASAPRMPHRPFGGKVPPLVLPAPAPVVTPSPPPVRIQKPSTAKEPHVQTGGYGKLAPAQYRPKPPAAPVGIRYDSHGRPLLSPDEIPY
jgi:hypothetical protein